ncbi:uncharacterized protein PGTG_21147 [Puccinia graminis f. sp. tritici CRL 75-36-700-3]|uniref:Uncharacterized protein n=1 Tax=Puccinia graminis f. sp. tritici (strain CRL 75-36-700-3 / race SCCL) TaxID=418459 RepID=H6QQS8_PUCGT|nr:uncharacterized protein PGTG_21147 [Puccinia graminis f. sp. tritici CRL 75-36-700-3]EHS62826.1 hypothetical protein PGTG_21147 [Puccinia graminis f. sp. tritici CRL 75-36-700-3]
MATIEDLRQKPGSLFNPEDNTSPLLLTNTHLLPKKIPNSKERSLTSARAPQLVSLRQAYSNPWGVNIPPLRQAALQSSSPSPSPPSSSPSSSFSSAFKLSHFKSLSRLSVSSLDNPAHQERQEQSHLASGPELIKIPEQSLPSSTTNSEIDRKNDNLKNLLMANIHRSSRDSPAALNQSPDLNFKYPTSPSPAKSITTQSIAHMTSLVNPISSQSIISADLLPSLHKVQSTPRSICSPFSLVGSPQLASEPSLSPHSSQSQLPVSDKSPTPPSSPPTTRSSPSNCQTCRFPLSRASSESSFLLGLSYRSPLFDDFDEEGLPGHPHESSSNHEPPFADERDQVSRQPSFCSSSPDSSHPLNTWWSDLPPHRRAHIIEAESWPIFTPSAPVPILGSPMSGHCACSSDLSTSDDNLRDPSKHSQDSSHPSSTPSSGSRPSLSTNLNLLIPTPLEQDETDPLLSAHPPKLDSFPSSTSIETTTPGNEACETESSSQPTRKKKRRGEESAPKSSESLLTKSLRRLSRKLPNIQWGNLSVRMHTNEGAKVGDHEIDEEGGPGEEENVLPSGVVDDQDSSVILAGDEEQAQISRLVKSWTSDNIQPQNSLNGSFIVDPEMEWSSMMVQLETFSPNSNKKPHKLRTQTERTLPRNMRGEQQHSRRSDSTSMGGRNMGGERRRSVDGEDESLAPSGQDPQPTKRSQSRKRLSRNQALKQQHHSPNHHHQDRRGQQERKLSVKITRRVVSNPLHLLQLSLELEMMRKFKIKSPLKQRSMKLILTKLPPSSSSSSSSAIGNHIEFEYVRSPLRFEI